jgi:exodeoxyribonuclease-3
MLKITTWNVNGIRAREAQLLAWVEQERPDVLCLQEVKASRENVPEALGELPGYWCYWHGHKGYSGVALLLSKATFSPKPIYAHPEFDHETRIVTAKVGDLLFASIYVPNGGKDLAAKVRFLDALDAFAERTQAAGEKLILCGDLNVAREPRDVHPSLQKPQQIGQTPEERSQLERLISRGLVDLSRKFHPDDDRLYTWWAPWRNLREKNVGWRLDYVLCSKELADLATSCTAHREFGTSDHGPVQAQFEITIARGEEAPEMNVGHDATEPESQARSEQLSLF